MKRCVAWTTTLFWLLVACNGDNAPDAPSTSTGGTGGASSATGTNAGGSTQSGDVKVSVEPKSASTFVGGIIEFSAVVTGTTDTSVTWSIEEARTDGAISPEGVLTAPSSPGVYHVVATSNADTAVRDIATITVGALATGEPGVWEHVTPAGISLDKSFHDGGNFGAQEVFVDPANPNVLYLSATYQGVWKSTDYGLTWTKVSEDGGPLDLGAAWAMGLDRDPARDPSTPPVLYSTQGYGPQQGIFRSTDGGATWTRFSTGETGDLGSISVDPNDKNHVIAGIRVSTHVLESKDGGETWNDLGPAGVKDSNHVYFVNSTTWLLVSEWGDGSAGTRRTTDSGASWNKVSSCERFHGSSQPFIEGNGQIFAPCVDGILKSTDDGATWEKVADGAASAIVATGTYLYVATGWATQGAWDPNPRRAERAGGGALWESYTEVPAGMTNGPHRVAVTFDGAKFIIVSANWLGGVWRYIEP